MASKQAKSAARLAEALGKELRTCDPTAVQIYGPYPPSPGRTRWRIQILDSATGAKRSVTCPTREEANLLIEQLQEELPRQTPITCHQAIDQFIAYKATYLAPVSLRTLRDRLYTFLPNISLNQITKEKAEAIYEADTRRVAKFGLVKAATHHKRLRNAKELFGWLQKRGIHDSNPFEKVEPIGRANAGKAQPTETEAKKLDACLFAAARAGDEGALALLVQLFLGLRSSEALRLEVGAVEREGRKITIVRGKTKNARRTLELFPEVASLLWKHCQGRPATERVFAARHPKVPAPNWMYKRLEKFCLMAGIPQYCPHSLRGLHSSLALVSGATTYQVAASLGHASFATTARHYADPSAIDNSRARRVADTLRSGDEPLTQIQLLMGNLSAAQKAQLRSLLQE